MPSRRWNVGDFEKRLEAVGLLDQFMNEFRESKSAARTAAGKAMKKPQRQKLYHEMVKDYEGRMSGNSAATTNGDDPTGGLTLLPRAAFTATETSAADTVVWVNDHLEGDPPKPSEASALAWGLFCWASTNASTKRAFYRYCFVAITPTRGQLPPEPPEDNTSFFRTIKQLRDECEERTRKGLHAL